jgi:phosphoglycolate phosphatase
VNQIRAARGLGILRIDAVESMVGEGARVLLQRALPEVSESDQAGLLAEFLRQYEAVCLETTRPYEGIDAVLERATERRLPLGLLTNKPERISHKILESFQWGRYFKITAGGDTYPHRKPDPRGLIDVASRLGVPISETVLVGDSAIDGQTAQAAGAPWIHVTWGYGKEDAMDLPCWVRVDRPADLAKELLLSS